MVVGFSSPLLVPVVAASELSATWKTGLSGFLMVGIPEIFTLLAVSIMGKAGYDAIMGRVRRILGGFMKEYGPPRGVSRRRYRIGLVMFCAPFLLAFVEPYFGDHLPWHEQSRTAYAVGGDVMLGASLFVLGGEFWDKLRALFIHEAKARLTTASP